MEKYNLNTSRWAGLALRAGLIILLLSVSSCTWIGAPLRVLRGNFLVNNGEDILAVYFYLSADVQEEWNSWIRYNVGTVYLDKGEFDPGVAVLDQAVPEESVQPLSGQHQELLFRRAFNLGVAYFDLRRYAEAALAFTRALRFKPGSWDAKINLELSLNAMRATPPAKPTEQESESEDQKEVLDTLQAVHLWEVPMWGDTEPAEQSAMDW